MMPAIPQPAFFILKCEHNDEPYDSWLFCVKADDPESQELFMHLAQSLMMKGIVGTVSPIKTGCLNRCALGPVMLVEPGHTMYVGLTKEKIDKIIDEHIIGGNVVSEYVVPEAMWGEAISPASLVK